MSGIRRCSCFRYILSCCRPWSSSSRAELVMSDAQAKSDRGKSDDLPVSRSAQPAARNLPKVRIRIIPLLITLATTALAGVLGWAMWEAYMGAPWTRDGTVRTYVVTMAPEVAGRIVELPVIDNQFVHKGDLLLVIEPTDYKIALDLAEAAVRQMQSGQRRESGQRCQWIRRPGCSVPNGCLINRWRASSTAGPSHYRILACD